MGHAPISDCGELKLAIYSRVTAARLNEREPAAVRQLVPSNNHYNMLQTEFLYVCRYNKYFNLFSEKNT